MNELQTMPLRFRVWDKEQGEFITHNKIYRIEWQTEGAKDTVELDLTDFYVLMEIVGDFSDGNFIVSQDTGIKDKDGKHIFTGDIVERFAENLPAVINYALEDEGGIDRGAIVCKYPDYITKNRKGFNCFYPTWESEISIIGNIWDNPELLVKKEKK